MKVKLAVQSQLLESKMSVNRLKKNLQWQMSLFSKKLTLIKFSATNFELYHDCCLMSPK